MATDHERFMGLAIEEAERGAAAGNMAVGSVIVRDGEVLGRGRNEATSAFYRSTEDVARRRAALVDRGAPTLASAGTGGGE